MQIIQNLKDYIAIHLCLNMMEIQKEYGLNTEYILGNFHL